MSTVAEIENALSQTGIELHRVASLESAVQQAAQAAQAAATHTGAILLTGPGQAKTELSNYARDHRPELLPRISGVEALDHPSDKALVALARKFFKADDRMHSQAH